MIVFSELRRLLQPDRRTAQRLEAFAKRVRRRTASPLYRYIDDMLARRATPFV
jgi:hypothetical protein